MPRQRLHNALFALIIGIVLGITAWSLYQRSGGPASLAIPELPAAKGRSRIDTMIESGALSKEPALFWSTEPGQGEGGGD